MIITIGRQFGSGGREIGEKLSEALGMAYYDKEILELTAKESGLSQKLFEEADERTRKSIPSGIFGMRFPFLGDGTIAASGLSNEMLFKIQSDVMRGLASKQPCIFIGRCADYILRERTDCMSVFVSANDEDRIKRIISRDNISIEKARYIMERIDNKRAAYYRYYSNKTWGASASYDICINSSFLGIDGAVGLLKETVKKIESARGKA